MPTYQPATKGYYGDLRTLRRKNPNTNLSVLQKLAGMGQYVRDQDVTADMYENPEQMLEDMQARQAAERQRQQQQQRQQPAPQPVRQPMFTQPQGDFDMLFPGQQFQLLQNMANEQEGMFAAENASRVSQSRELTRMEHEQQMERIRQDGILKRLQMEQQMEAQRMKMGAVAADKARGVIYNSEWYK
jgi:hypothetical protein